MTRNWTQEQLDDIVYLYTAQGWTIKQIEQKYKCGHSFVGNYLASQNIPRNKRKKNRLLREQYFKEIDTPEKAYFLGLLFTDGSIVCDATKQRQTTISLELVESDKSILDLFKEELNCDGALTYNKRSNRKNGTFNFQIRSDIIANDLAKYNIVQNKTYIINELIFPTNYIIDYLRGFIDGDGSIYYSNNMWHINICGHSQNIIKQVATTINDLLNLENHSIQCSKDVYRYTWNGNFAKQVIKLLYTQGGTCAIARKSEKARQALEDKNA